MTKPLTKEKITQRIKEKHGDRYIYFLDDVDYKNQYSKMKIKCKQCGYEFFQTIKGHMSGRGCPKCAQKIRNKSRQPSIEELFDKLAKIHNGVYKYPQKIYENNRTKINIECTICGNVFTQTIGQHLTGCGCPHCANAKNADRCRSTIQEFIKKVQNIYGDQIGFDKTEYKGATQKTWFFCKKCQRYFLQTPASLLSGHACQFCGRAAGMEKRSIKPSAIIDRLVELYGDDFTYYKEKITRINRKAPFTCKHCKKTFYATPKQLLMGNGCPKCKRSRGERFISKWLKENNINFIEQKSFSDCRDKQPLPFDFFLPDYNMCIEFQGPQHFNAHFFITRTKSKEKGNELFETQKRHDQIKKDYCKKNGIQLREIKYTKSLSTTQKSLENIIEDCKIRS